MNVFKVLLLEGTLNLIICAAKLGVGLHTGSTSLLADAFHSATDAVNSVLGMFVHRLSRRPADLSHPYGHAKFEYLAVFFLAVLLCVIAIEIVMRALTRIGEQPTQNINGLVLLCVLMGAGLAVSLFERYWAKKLASPLLNADAKHTLGDVITSLAAILGWQLGVFGYPWIDALVAIGMALYVIYLAIALFKECVPILVDQATLNEAAIRLAAKQIPGVINISQVRSRSTGEGTILEIKASVAGHISTLASHHIADQLEADLSKRYNLLDVIVHIEPS